MHPRTILITHLAALLLSSNVHGQSLQDTQALWDELTRHQTARDLIAAEKTADKLVTSLTPAATDFSLGVMMNSALHNRASLRFTLSRFPEAEADLITSVAQAKQIQPPAGLPEQAIPQMMAMVDDRVRLSLRGLTNFYLAAGDLERATQTFQEALAIQPLWKKQADQDSTFGYQVLAAEMSSMEGTFYRSTGDYLKATEAYVSRLEEIDHAWKLVLQSQGGAENDFTNTLKMNYLRGRANVLMELAEVASLQSQHVAATGFCREARSASTETLPLYRQWAEHTRRTNPAVSEDSIRTTLEMVEIGLNYLNYERSAAIFRAAGQHDIALELMMEGMARRGADFQHQRMLTLEYNVMRPEENMKLIGDLQANLGQFAEAEQAYQTAREWTLSHYPKGHPAILDIDESRALLAQLRGDAEQAKEIAVATLESRMANLKDVLSFADESQRLAYRSSMDSWSLYANLDMPIELADTILRTKGIVLESLLEDHQYSRASSDSALAQTFEQLQSVRRRLMEAILSGSGDSDQARELRATISRLEDELKSDQPSHQAVSNSLTTTAAAVSQALPEGALLIEFIHYRDFQSPGTFTQRYGAMIISGEGEPQFVPLATVDAMDRAIHAYAKSVRQALGDDDMRRLLRHLTDLVWKPLTPYLPASGKRLILSPDASLNFLSFATLLTDDDRLIGEDWPISYVSSGRDLLRSTPRTRDKSMELIANPDFQSPSTSTIAAQRADGANAALGMRGVLGQIALSPLPGTEAEEKILNCILSQDWQWEVRSHLQREASEAAVNQVASPAILHLATHGFYLPMTGRVDPLLRTRSYWSPDRSAGGQANATPHAFSDVVLAHPMHRSGVALSGGEATLKAWGAGRVLDTANDGILTAEEMARLQLAGTWLVVLSACETGLGEARSGEGVLGMRRGLIQAGAQNLLLTLWPVADKETVLYMADFYRSLNGGQLAPTEAAALTQAKYLKQFREKQGLAASVRLAGAFILSFQH